MEEIKIVKVNTLSELFAELSKKNFPSGSDAWDEEAKMWNVTCSDIYSNGETGWEVSDWKELMGWLCRPKGIFTLIKGTHTGSCGGDLTASIAVSKMHGLYFLTKKWEDEEEPRLLKVISANKEYK